MPERRQTLTREVIAEVLILSRRRCALCYGLDGDFSLKKGQIAHIDRDPSNSRAENLAFLCANHHDDYDSRTSQSKGLTPSELLVYRDDLYRLIKEGGLLDPSPQIMKTEAREQRRTRPICVEVYDRRVQIYRAARDFIGQIGSSALADGVALNFAKTCDEALFLFDDEIAGILWEMYRRAIQIRTIQHVLPHTPVGERRSSLAEKEADHTQWIMDQLQILRDKMKHYLRLA